MENVEYRAHQLSTDASTTLQDDQEDIRAHHSTSLPPIDTISNAPLVNEEDELDQGEETPEDAQNLMPPSPYFDPDVWKELDGARPSTSHSKPTQQCTPNETSAKSTSGSHAPTNVCSLWQPFLPPFLSSPS